ncbi:SAM-dependent methyltransferase [Frankia sp. AiPa1]|nr:SAM-dependent methyltransferase [Frankia sp. AiPa1]
MGPETFVPGEPEGPNVARVYDYFLGGAHNFSADRDAAARVIATWPQIRDTTRVNRLFLGDALPAGSYLVLTHATGGQDPKVAEAAEVYRRTTGPFQLRGREEVSRFFDSTDLVEPGVVLLPGWDNDRQRRATTAGGRLPVYAGVGRLR